MIIDLLNIRNEKAFNFTACNRVIFYNKGHFVLLSYHYFFLVESIGFLGHLVICDVIVPKKHMYA